MSQNAAERRFALVVTVVFLIVAAAVMARHEPWRDEMQAWLIARDSRSVRDLLAHVRYEGHPALWYLALYVLQRLVAPAPAVMQGFHLLVATSAVGVVARYAPFGRAQRAAFAAGYFPLYEYGVIARNYSICLALVAIACALFTRRRTRVFVLAGVLALLAQTIVYGTILAIAFGAALLIEQCLPGSLVASWPRPARAQVAGALLIVGFGVATAALQMLPPSDTGFATSWYESTQPRAPKNQFANDYAAREHDSQRLWTV
jgi:hypothetical protein